MVNYKEVAMRAKKLKKEIIETNLMITGVIRVLVGAKMKGFNVKTLNIKTSEINAESLSFCINLFEKSGKNVDYHEESLLNLIEKKKLTEFNYNSELEVLEDEFNINSSAFLDKYIIVKDNDLFIMEEFLTEIKNGERYYFLSKDNNKTNYIFSNSNINLEKISSIANKNADDFVKINKIKDHFDKEMLPFLYIG